jgi:plastocyanin
MSLPRVFSVVLLAASLPASALAQPATATQTIHLSNFKILPVPIQLAAGQPVTLVIVNDSGSGHDFTAKEFFARARITAGAAPNGKLEFAGHETKSITLVPAAGSYPAHCSHFLHAGFGMKDTIVVR